MHYIQLLNAILADISLRDGHKARIAMRLAECDKKLIDGADEHLQVYDLRPVGVSLQLDRNLSWSMYDS